jgi:hypothetical protein
MADPHRFATIRNEAAAAQFHFLPPAAPFSAGLSGRLSANLPHDVPCSCSAIHPCL